MEAGPDFLHLDCMNFEDPQFPERIRRGERDRSQNHWAQREQILKEHVLPVLGERRVFDITEILQGN